MGEEGIKGANLGVVLMIFAAVLGLVLIVFTLSRGMANTGLTNMTEKLEAANNSDFTDFDGKVVVGERVNSALSEYKGKPVAILVSTQGLIDKTVNGSPDGSPLTTQALPDVMNKGAMELLASTANIANHETMTFAFGLNAKVEDGVVVMDAGTRLPMYASSTGRDADKYSTYIQYNALLEPTDDKGIVTTDGSTRNSAIWWNQGSYTFDGSFRSNNGKTLFDYVTTNTTKTGMTETIPGAARFNSYLLKDGNGVILGIVFEQIGG